MEKLYQAVELLLQTTAKSLRSTDLETAKQLRDLAAQVKVEYDISLTLPQEEHPEPAEPEIPDNKSEQQSDTEQPAVPEVEPEQLKSKSSKK